MVSAMLVNGVDHANGTVLWSRLPADEWVHVYIEAATAFEDDVNLFSRVATGADNAGGGNLKGRIHSAHLWSVAVPRETVAGMAQSTSFQYHHYAMGSLAYFNMEEGSGAYLLDEWSKTGFINRGMLLPLPPGGPVWVKVFAPSFIQFSMKVT